MPTDSGRPISDIRMGLAIGDLNALISAVLGEGRALEREVRAEDGRWYSLHLRPYWTGTGKIDGVLLALVDVHALKENQEAARREERFVSAILDAAGRAALVVVLDAEGRIIHFNRACQELSGYSLEEVRGRRPWDFLILSEEVAGVEGVFRELIGGTTNVHENYWVAKGGHRRRITWWNNIITGEDGRVKYAIGSGIDITERQQARAQARQSEATVRALLETAAQAIIGINDAGYIVLANAAAEGIFGYMREEMLDQPLEKLLPQHLRQQHVHHRLNFFQRPENKRMGKRLDVVGLRKDGTEFPAEISLSQVATGEGSLAVAFLTDITERKRNDAVLRRSEAEARASQQQLRELTTRVLNAQEEERRRVSRELHDDLNQQLATLAIELGSIEATLPESERKTHERLRSLEKRVNGLSDNVRRTAYQLHPSTLEHLGLADALETYCSEFSAQEGIKVGFQLRKMPGAIPKNVALCLYRVAQEALRNVARHAGAARASVTLAGAGDGITLTVEDQGRGFDPSMVEGKRGLGLISMKERVAAAGGFLTIKTRPKVGTRVEIRIPLTAGSE
jgi:PAS domain S-box-containing protein